MNIEVKTLRITKSMIQQMDYTNIADSKAEVLGWVNMDNRRFVILKTDLLYHKTDFLTEIIKEHKSVQFSLPTGGYEFPVLINIKITTHGARGSYSYSPKRDDNENIKLYDRLISFKRRTEKAGQIYY